MQQDGHALVWAINQWARHSAKWHMRVAMGLHAALFIALLAKFFVPGITSYLADVVALGLVVMAFALRHRGRKLHHLSRAASRAYALAFAYGKYSPSDEITRLKRHRFGTYGDEAIAKRMAEVGTKADPAMWYTVDPNDVAHGRFRYLFGSEPARMALGPDRLAALLQVSAFESHKRLSVNFRKMWGLSLCLVVPPVAVLLCITGTAAGEASHLAAASIVLAYTVLVASAWLDDVLAVRESRDLCSDVLARLERFSSVAGTEPNAVWTIAGDYFVTSACAPPLAIGE